MTERKQVPGKLVWFELVSNDARRAQQFYGEVLGWKVKQFAMGGGFTYDMICTGDSLDTMIGGYTTPRRDQGAHWIGYVSVDDVDAAARVASAAGGRVVEPPADIPGVGRWARIADPQGAELALLRNSDGDPPDVAQAPHGAFLWHELHTTDAPGAAAFYEKVVGYTDRAQDMGPGGTYHVLSRDGVDRGGIMGDAGAGTVPHWLPYVSVDDVDAVVARATRLGGKLCMGPTDIPGIGRFGVFQDPTGAALAVMKPLPRAK
jgi:predicted enzyme related to lactoylglutathione lyase